MKKVLEPETAELITRMQEQLAAIERKLDTLISKSSSGSAEKRSFDRPFQQSAHMRNRDDRSYDGNFRERVLHKAVCAECQKECEVPFRPTGDRPVYCKECFSKRKAASSYDYRHERPSGAGEKRKFYERKKPAHKRKKSKR